MVRKLDGTDHYLNDVVGLMTHIGCSILLVSRILDDLHCRREEYILTGAVEVTVFDHFVDNLPSQLSKLRVTRMSQYDRREILSGLTYGGKKLKNLAISNKV